MGFDFAVPFFPLYIREMGVTSFGEVALWSGILISMGPALGSLANAFWGMAADRFGAKPMLIRALATLSLMLALTGLSTTMWHLVLTRAGMGLLGGFAPVAFATMIASGPRANTAQALGVLQAAQFLPMAIGPLIGGLIADRGGLRLNFFVAGGLCFTAMLVVAMLLRKAPDQMSAPGHEAKAPSVPVWQLIRSPDFAVPFGLVFIAYGVERSLVPILPLYVVTLGVPPEAVASSAGLALAAGAVASAISGPLLGRLATRFPLPALVIFTLASGMVLFVLLALTSDFTQFLVLRAILALLAGGLPTLAFTMGTQATAQSSLGRQTGLLTGAMQLANASSPLLAGLVAVWSLRAVFVMDSAVLALALAVVGYLAWRRRAQP